MRVFFLVVLAIICLNINSAEHPRVIQNEYFSVEVPDKCEVIQPHLGAVVIKISEKSSVIFENFHAKSLTEAVAKIKKDMNDHAKVQIVETPSKLDGDEARILNIIADDGNVKIHVVFRLELAFNIVCAAPANEFKTSSEKFDSIVKSFKWRKAEKADSAARELEKRQ